MAGDKSKSSFRSSKVNSDGPFDLGKATAADLLGLIAAMGNVTSSPEGAVEFIFSEGNLCVKLNSKGDKDKQTVTCVFIKVEGGSVSAHTGDIQIANIQDFD